MKLDRVIISCDDNAKFKPFWPLIRHTWKRFFPETEVWLARVTWVTSLDDYMNGIINFPPVEGIPISNQAKMARYYLAAHFSDYKVTMTNDIDLLILQREYTENLLKKRWPGSLLTIGSELYTEGTEKGKFTAGYLTAEGAVWRRLLNPQDLLWHDFIHSFEGMRAFDHKEDITRAIHHEDPDTFSDESLLRALVHINGITMSSLPRGYSPYTARALCRSDWRYDRSKIIDGTIVEAHLPRPWDDHKDKIQPLLDYLEYV